MPDTHLIADASIFAENIINTVRESLLVLGKDLRVVSANDAFYRTFRVSKEETIGRRIYELGNSQWDIPRLRELLEKIVPENNQFNDFEVKHSFPSIGHKTMFLNARKIKQDGERRELILLAIEDVTEREKQKEQLEQAYLIIKTTPDIMLRFGRDERLLFANRAAEELFSKPQKEIIGKTLEELFASPDILVTLHNAFRSVTMTKKNATVEIRYREKTLQVLLAPERGEQGNVLSFMSAGRDIERLKQIEDALTEAVEMARKNTRDAEEGKRILTAIAEDADEKKRILTAMMDNLPEGLLITDGKGIVLLMSAYMSQLTGLMQKDVLGRQVEIVEDRLTRSAAGAFVPEELPVQRALRRGEKTQGEDRTVLLPDGKTTNIAINAAPIKNDHGRVIGALAAWRDISEKKRAEDILRRNEYELRTLVDSYPDIIVRLDRNMRYLYANPTYERITGMSKEQIAGKTNEDLGMPRDQAAHWREHVQSVTASGREGSMEFEFYGIFGKRFFWGKIVPEFAKSGVVETVLIIARDITERKKAEEQVRYISFHDEVTTLFNRAYFEEELKRLDTDRMLPLGIIMGDVNHLKLTNDVFGHMEGDRLLKRIAEILRKSCRNEDIIARWGGDEFAVILPKTNEATAYAVLERVKLSCRESRGTAIQPSLALGTAIKDARGQNIYHVVRKAEELMYDNKLAERRQNEDLALSALLRRARENSYDAEGHTGRLEKLIGDFMQGQELHERHYDSLLLFVRLHDIGKATIPPEILQKQGRLSPEEWNIVKRYPEASYRVASTFSDTTRIADEVFSIREQWNGGGYPRGIREKEIPYFSRLLAVIDAYDAMTHPRPYARALSREEAIAELRRNAGRQFDPGLTERFIASISQQPVAAGR
jgi:diguanylate cyclase (GGDEF)-like protein/PAS domain S-box-containing protein